jgi:hypothetical protein
VSDADRSTGTCRGAAVVTFWIGGLRRVSVAAQTALDDLERQEVLALLAEDPPKPVDVLLVELPVAGRRPLRVEETLALEEPDLGDGDVGKLVLQQGQHVPDR